MNLREADVGRRGVVRQPWTRLVSLRAVRRTKGSSDFTTSQQGIAMDRFRSKISRIWLHIRWCMPGYVAIVGNLLVSGKLETSGMRQLQCATLLGRSALVFIHNIPS